MEQFIKDMLKGMRGVTRSCSKCKTKIASQVKMIGSFSVFCSNKECKSYETIFGGLKFLVTVTSVAIFLFITLTVRNEIQAKKNITCNAFKTYEEAKLTFDSDPAKYHNLDKNNNHIPCEDLI